MIRHSFKIPEDLTKRMNKMLDKMKKNADQFNKPTMTSLVLAAVEKHVTDFE